MATLRQDLRETIKMIDAELLLKVCTDAELIPATKFAEDQLADAYSEIVFETVKAILKHRVERSTFRRNQDGCSISIPFPQEYTEMRSVVRTMRRIRDTEISVFMNTINNPQTMGEISAVNIQVRDDRFVFYINYARGSFYDNALIYQAVFEIVYFFDKISELYQTQFGTIQASYQLVVEAEEAEIRAAEERRRREEEARLAREAEERRRREEEERRVREENERRQNLVRAGATQGGIDIARRLQELLRTQ